MPKITMLPGDVISASEAECYATIGGSRYNVINAVSLEAKMEKKKKEVPILGRVANGNKTTGAKLTGKMTMHYVSSIMRRIAIDYLHTGKDTYFEIQCTNEDPTSSVGRQTVVLKGCNFDSIILAKFAAGENVLDEEIAFTFEDADMPEEFGTLAGMTE
ncbi:MAG TPA: hypothetical protein DHW78_08375 [Ruminococcaceae bacterium]|jgi:hypothetical protein|nr:hypothetical protein [Oscillospiraceae bacterium]HCM24320.1 hypothetical protein [Oscillospiraceae bacterium]